jgi:hypothetical protein
MKQRIFIKQCGRDEDGNTGPLSPKGVRLENVYPQNGVAIFTPQPEAMHQLRGPSFDDKGEVVYQRPMEDLLKEFAEGLAGGRPYFIGTVEDLPADPYFRNAWRWDESSGKPVIVVDLQEAKAFHQLALSGALRAKLHQLADPLAALDSDVEAEKKKALAAYKAVDLSNLTDLNEIKKMVPKELL